MITPMRVRSIAALVTLLSLVANGLYWWQISRSQSQLKSETVAQAELRARQLNGAVADQIAILIRYVDFAVQEVAETYEPGKHKRFIDHAATIEQRFPAGSLLQVAIIDARGYLETSTLGVKEKVYLGDREHFKVHLRPGKDQLFVSAPVFGRVSKQWSIQFTRPIRRNGSFAGVAVISLSPEYLHKTLSVLSLASDDSIAVIRQSGEYLARNRGIETALGKSVTATRAFLGPDAAPSGTFRDASKFDSIVRLYHWQRLEDVPIIVTLGISEATLLKPVDTIVSRNLWQAGIATVMLWLFTLGVIVLLLRMNTQQKLIVQGAQQIQHLAFYDSLTDLPNRRLLNDRLCQALAAQKRNPWFGAVLFIDLDNFKQLNDRHGHVAGDLLLVETAERLKGCVREMDTVARYGGDEFVVMIQELEPDGIRAKARVRAIAEKIRGELSKPFEIDPQSAGKAGTVFPYQCTASIGVAVFNNGEGSMDDILNQADQAMYRAKEAGRNSICIHGDPAA